jgi:hypothetical protein
MSNTVMPLVRRYYIAAATSLGMLESIFTICSSDLMALDKSGRLSNSEAKWS